jgi:hypothetical protein
MAFIANALVRAGADEHTLVVLLDLSRKTVRRLVENVALARGRHLPVMGGGEGDAEAPARRAKSCDGDAHSAPAAQQIPPRGAGYAAGRTR